MAAEKPELIARFAAAQVSEALLDTPAVLVNGPRQCGKTTLVRHLLKRPRAYVTLDDETMLAAARFDPVGFIAKFDHVAIDEVQRAPELLRTVKRAIDEDRRPGRFLLTGSANLLTLPKVSDSLAGRMQVVTLLPLSVSELLSRKPSFLQRIFNGQLPRESTGVRGDDLMAEVLMGGYPQMRFRSTPARQRAWARDYLAAILQRDVRDIADIEKLNLLPRLLRALSHHAARLVNFSQLGGELSLDDKTTRKYLGVLEQLYLLRKVEPWSHNRLSRMVKTPKVHFLDSGLLAAMSSADARKLARDREIYGALLETFVLSELAKQANWLGEVEGIYYYRDKDKAEVDFVIEHVSGDIVGVEVKAAAAATGKDFKGLHKLAAAAGKHFKLGMVLYDGEHTVPFGERMLAAPISAVWS
jgi:uncharacterized protein